MKDPLGRLEDAGLEFAFWFRSQVIGKAARRWASEEGLNPSLNLENEERFYTHLFERCLPHDQRNGAALIWDVGCRNWSYAKSVLSAFPKAEVIPVELEPDRIAPGLIHRRAQIEAACVNARNEGRSVRPIYADFTQLSVPFFPASPQGYLFLFPFVSPRPCRKWGLPSRFSDFSAMLKQSLAISRTSGNPRKDWVMSLHQGDWEGEIAERVYRNCGFKPALHQFSIEEIQSLGWPAPHPHWVFTAYLDLQDPAKQRIPGPQKVPSGALSR